MTPIEVVQRYLRTVTDTPVVWKVPTKRPRLFVRVDQGAPQGVNEVADRALVIVQVYGDDLDAVVDLAIALREAMRDIDLHDVHALGWGGDTGPVEYPDPDIPETHRWQFSGQLLQALR